MLMQSAIDILCMFACAGGVYYNDRE